MLLKKENTEEKTSGNALLSVSDKYMVSAKNKVIRLGNLSPWKNAI